MILSLLFSISFANAEVLTKKGVAGEKSETSASFKQAIACISSISEARPWPPLGLLKKAKTGDFFSALDLDERTISFFHPDFIVHKKIEFSGGSQFWSFKDRESEEHKFGVVIRDSDGKALGSTTTAVDEFKMTGSQGETVFTNQIVRRLGELRGAIPKGQLRSPIKKVLCDCIASGYLEVSKVALKISEDFQIDVSSRSPIASNFR